MHSLPKTYKHLRMLNGLLIFVVLIGAVSLHSQTPETVISGTVKDQSGAVVVGARIEITGGDLTEAIVLTTDGLGNFISQDLKQGTYSLRVMRDGFEPL